MKLELLVSALNQQPKELAQKMNIQSDALIVNQTDHYGYEEWEQNNRRIRAFSMAERGVGLSRNHALLRADRDICLFSDEDIIYRDGYEELVCREFEKNPKADMILFHIQVAESRRTYTIEKYGRVRIYNSGRYPTYSFAAKTEKLHKANITFSLLFGGGARYSNGEDSLFLRDCLRQGIKIYRAPVILGEEEERDSTWFHGYTEKFFYDRGVLYHYLYGSMARLLAFRFIKKHGLTMCQEISQKQAYQLMCRGLTDAGR